MIWGRISVVLEASTAKVISPRPNKAVVSQRSRTLRSDDGVLVCVSIGPRPHPPLFLRDCVVPGADHRQQGPEELNVYALAHELKPKRVEVSPFLVGQVGAESLQTLTVVGCGELLEARVDFLGKQAHRGKRLGKRQEAGLAHHQ